MEAKVTKIEFQELADLLETASYHNNAIGFEIPQSQRWRIGAEREFKCDKLADILLNGGYIIAWDMYAEALSLDDKLSKKAFKYDPEDYSIAYKLRLKDVLEGLSKDIALTAKYFDDGDMFDAWNLVQFMMFNEIIYG